MRLKKHIEKQMNQTGTQRARSKARSNSIATHRLFVPILTIWGTAFLGLAIIVLPTSAIDRMTTLSGLGVLGGMAKFAFASIAALFGGGLGFVISAAFRDRTIKEDEKVSIVSAIASRRVQPIDPVIELGSESLDAPIESIPFTAEEDGVFEELYAEMTDSDADSETDEAREGGTSEAASAEKSAEEAEPAEAVAETKISDATYAPANIPIPALGDGTKQPIGSPASNGSWSLTQFTPESGTESKPEANNEVQSEKPIALDLGEFAEMPGRNAVWVEEQSTQAPVSKQQPRPVPAESALEKLRQTPTEELSIVQMVERFAGALHNHQQAERARQPKNTVGRDAALAEALKALTLFTERGFDKAPPHGVDVEVSNLGQTERELREALVKLQTLRGAA